MTRIGMGVVALSIIGITACSDGGGTAENAPAPAPAADGGTTRTGFTFAPSNLPAPYLAPARGSLRITTKCGDDAVIDTTADKLPSCATIEGAPAPTIERVAQDGAPELDVLVVGDFTVDEGAMVKTLGERPLVIVATGRVRIDGTIGVVPLGRPFLKAAAGGAVSSGPDGLGLGKGGGSTAAGAGGAGHCGAGGNGVAQAGTAGLGGKPYGTPELRPLRAGSSGGANGASANDGGGFGGGAIQITSAVSITIGAAGVINAGGGGAIESAGGGGSGGSILLEAPNVTVAGVLAANGGGGGHSYHATLGTAAEPGRASDQPAAGGFCTTTDCEAGAKPGGKGSAGTSANGADGEVTTGMNQSFNEESSGGGGGAGRIRINTTTGAAATTGTISPAPATGCATQGTLLTR